MLRATLSDLKNRQAACDAWINRHWATLSPLGYLLALAVTFGGSALSAYHSGFDAISAGLCGLLFILFVKLYARSVPAAQRVIDTLHPQPEDPAKPDEMPGWAIAVYMLIGIALFLTFSALEESYTYAPMALLVSWAVGHNLLHLFWRKRDGTRAFDAFDEQLDAWAAQYRDPIRALGAVLCFLLLPGGVALHAYESGFAQRMAGACAQCVALPGVIYLVAAACGVAAILFVALYAWLTSSVQRVTADPWKFVRPEPQSTKVPFWVRALHVLIGIVIFGSMAAVFGQPPLVKNKISFGEYGMPALILGWWIGGRGVLRTVWAKLPRGGGYTAAPN